jgi:hypothetical protein
MAATDQQVQQYANERVRVRAEQFRALVNSCRDDKAAIDDVYAACTQQNPTWDDERTDGPPNLLTPQDILAFNAFISLFLECIDGTAETADVQQLAANWPVFQAACVRPV